MSKIMIFLCLLASYGCCRSSATTTGKYHMTSENVEGVDRLENQEVICYYSWRGGLWCKWKGVN